MAENYNHQNAENKENQASGGEFSQEAILFGHLFLSGVDQAHAQVLFQFDINTIDNLGLLNKEILNEMEIKDPNS